MLHLSSVFAWFVRWSWSWSRCVPLLLCCLTHFLPPNAAWIKVSLLPIPVPLTLPTTGRATWVLETDTLHPLTQPIVVEWAVVRWPLLLTVGLAILSPEGRTWLAIIPTLLMLGLPPMTHTKRMTTNSVSTVSKVCPGYSFFLTVFFLYVFIYLDCSCFHFMPGLVKSLPSDRSPVVTLYSQTSEKLVHAKRQRTVHITFLVNLECLPSR